MSVPTWDSTKCIQCNNCAYVCPHATIRPFALTEEEAKNAPAAAKIVDVKAGKGKGVYKFSIAVSPLDCMGCGVCVGVCPVKALEMVSQESQADQQAVFDYMVAKVADKADMADTTSVKGSQFNQPLLEFSGSCAGCAETSYARLITQVCGDRMYISNATGCSSIWGGPAATSPYTVNKAGHGPAWANSLFEDNAEHGLGFYYGQKALRDRLTEQTKALMAIDYTDESIKTAAQGWLDTMADGTANAEATKKYVAALEAVMAENGDCGCDACKLAREILAHKEFLAKKSIWIFGGDGWAYDIGYGGVDHVLAQNQDVNILVLDTEVYSNTGGQASKSTPTGSVAKFAAAGKRTKKKDLGMMAMSYGYVYVATVAMGANPAQLIKAMTEAEAYHGPSLIIAYAPCINHGINMGLAQAEIRKAVDCGYWPLYRYNPAKAEAGENPMTVDSKEPTGNYQDFLKGEVRYTALAKMFPDAAAKLFEASEADAKVRRDNYKKMAGQE